MKKIFDILRVVFKALFTRPEVQKRPLCRHCGGGKCYGACQMDIERSQPNSKTKE
ncbi:MAG: hypothetical protein IKJ34_02560 [Mailhella sp.]|nr:hypothetical protein [Mailhella sp.]